MHELIDRGAFEPNLERIKGLLRQRRDAMLGALGQHLEGEAAWSEPEGGYFLWLDRLQLDAGELLTRAEAAGVTFVKGSDFFPAAGREAVSSGVFARSASARADADLAHRTARLAFSYASPSEIDEGVSILASFLR